MIRTYIQKRMIARPRMDAKAEMSARPISTVALSIRLQLTLWYTVIFLVLILGSGWVVYKYLEHALPQTLDTTLALRASQLATEIRYRDGQIRIRDSFGSLLDTDPSQNGLADHNTDGDDSALVRLLDTQGHTIRATATFNELDIPAESMSQPLHGEPWQGTVRVHGGSDGQAVRLYSMALFYEGEPFAVLQVGESQGQIRDILRDVGSALLLLVPFVLLLGAFGSYWLASRAFAPIHRLTSTARQIKAGDLSQRVPVPKAHDEVYNLAVTLNEMIERLEASFLRQQRFVADASHELRTPIAAIRSKTDVTLMETASVQEYVSVLQTINGEAERLSHLISDLLALARADEGQAPLERETVRLDLLAQAVAANSEFLAGERGIHMQLQVSEPVTILGDEARLIQAIMNLLDNALIYTPQAGCVQLTVEGDATSARIIVRDTGEGIAAKHLPHIFERFYRCDPARKRREGGSSGLGLTIVDWIVRAHGGTIDVVSEVGHGSTFTVTIPLQPSEK
jgi:heavy metal sensor kinase